jgi:hypothetical protein
MRARFALPALIAAAAAALAPAPLPPDIPRTAPVIEEPVPLPRPRPKPVADGLNNLGVPSMGAGPEPLPLTGCYLALTAELAVAEPLPPIAQPNSCDALDVVRLSAVNIDRRKVTLTPPVTLRCPMATALATWMREDVAPAAESMGSPLRGFDNYESFE